MGCSGSLSRLSPNRKTQALFGVRNTRETMGVVSGKSFEGEHLAPARCEGAKSNDSSRASYRDHSTRPSIGKLRSGAMCSKPNNHGPIGSSTQSTTLACNVIASLGWTDDDRSALGCHRLRGCIHRDDTNCRLACSCQGVCLPSIVSRQVDDKPPCCRVLCPCQSIARLLMRVGEPRPATVCPDDGAQLRSIDSLASTWQVSSYIVTPQRARWQGCDGCCQCIDSATPHWHFVPIQSGVVILSVAVRPVMGTRLRASRPFTVGYRDRTCLAVR